MAKYAPNPIAVPSGKERWKKLSWLHSPSTLNSSGENLYGPWRSNMILLSRLRMHDEKVDVNILKISRAGQSRYTTKIVFL